MKPTPAQAVAAKDDGLCWPVCAALACQLVLLVMVAILFRQALNPDAVAYLQLARHYAAGNTSLAISGHWSPLISWIIAIFLKLGLPPLVAGRVFMVVSGVVFLLGSAWLCRQAQMGRRLFVCGLWVMALLSVPWSAENITPDLMLAGIVCVAFAEMINSSWMLNPRRAVLCGLLWAIGFFCKSVALPLGILVTAAMAVVWWRTGADRLRVFRAAALTLLGMSLALVWIGVLSAHYGRFTVANSAGYNHALVGPDVERPLFLLDQGLRVPPPGRITIWEDPVSAYPDWSPFASGAAAGHQLRVVLHNLPVVVFMATSISLWFPFLLVAAALTWLRRGREPESSTGFWALLPVLWLAALFLPNYLLFSEQRYFYCAAPLMFAAAASYRWFGLRERTGIFIMLLAAGFLAPSFARAGLFLDATRNAGECARILAQRIEADGLAGPVVGSGKLSGGRSGLYLAYLLGQPWYGDEPQPSARDYESSRARLIIVDRGSLLAQELAASAAVHNLDSQLFGSGQDAENFPLQVFENPQPGSR